MASRFANTTGQPGPSGQINVYTALSLVGFLVMLVGVVWMVFFNMDYSEGYSRGSEGGIFTILDQGR